MREDNIDKKNVEVNQIKNHHSEGGGRRERIRLKFIINWSDMSGLGWWGQSAFLPKKSRDIKVEQKSVGKRIIYIDGWTQGGA